MATRGSPSPARRSLLDELLPRFDFAEFHYRDVSAPPERVYEAVTAVTLAEMPVVRFLFAVRSLPAFVAGKTGLPLSKDKPVLAQMFESGFTLLAEDPGREIVGGVVAQMWRLRGEPARISDAREFVAFDGPAYAKAAINFLVVPQGAGARVETETRVLATDADGRRAFSRYWRLVRPASGGIRRAWLRAIGDRAEGAARHSRRS